MTTMTNTFNLPSAIVAAVTNDGYSRGDSDISISQLVAPPRQVALKERHKHEIVEDVSERIYSLLGRAVHEILEQGGHDAITEERLFIERLGWRISGQFDSLSLNEEGNGWHLRDWKVCSIWTAKGGPKPEWESQLNLYALLLREHGFNVTHASIGAIYRDWSKRKATYEADYPPVGAAEIPVPIWPPGNQEAYLATRIILHKEARMELPLCSDEDRWAQPAKWAVMKGDNKRATRVFPSAGEAQDWAIASGLKESEARIEERPGESVRCAMYCPVLPFCDQGKALTGNGENS